MELFVVRAVLVGIAVALVAGVLGCFVVWRRMAYFGDSLAHSSLLGVVLGLLYGFGINTGIVLVCGVFAVILVWFQHTRAFSVDTAMGIMAHAALSIGMVSVSLLNIPEFDLHDYLFGDILTVNTEDSYWIYAGSAVILGFIVRFWPSLVLMTVNEDLAKAEGVKTLWMHLMFVFLMSMLVAVSIRIVGILLITSLLIIPAATARQLARMPETMAAAAAVAGAVAVVVGITASLRYDIPSGPSIVVAAVMLFAAISLISFLMRMRSRSRLTRKD